MRLHLFRHAGSKDSKLPKMSGTKKKKKKIGSPLIFIRREKAH